ncbi:MAG: glycoside hydrolase family 16 protein [Actinomycetota bacterium]|nr:glycoside hydrolase family 16 protein [Actinomycetota bacterium]
MSSDPGRSGAQPLDGTTHAQGAKIYVFTHPSTDVSRVRFYLDDPAMGDGPHRTERIAPYDFNSTNDGDGSAVAFDVGSLSSGSHTITAAQDQTNGQTRVLSATFTVRGTGTLVFEDNFDGRRLDTSEWVPYDGEGHAGNGQRRPSAFSLDGNGNLVLTAQMVDGDLVSGGMAHRRAYTYGRFEFRVRTDPDPAGAMSGVVLTWPQSGRWPVEGENDIYETGSAAGTRWPFYTFVHYGYSNQQHLHRHDADASDWHTMAMDWRPDAITIYRDGERVWTLTDEGAIPDVAHQLCIQLDAIRWRTLTRPVRMYVDYVRIYR